MKFSEVTLLFSEEQVLEPLLEESKRKKLKMFKIKFLIYKTYSDQNSKISNCHYSFCSVMGKRFDQIDQNWVLHKLGRTA
jgi:hypothetical protein